MTGAAEPPGQAREIRDFWLGEAPDDPATLAARSPRWFRPDAALDAECRERFAATIDAAATGELEHWTATPLGRLALILALDQFTRNVYRASALAFGHDARALAWCQDGIELGQDRELGFVERVFFYMPLQHAENLAAQDHSLAVMSRLAREAPPELRDFVAGSAEFAGVHRDIIVRFGRFPHRNAVLGRESTPEERAYLDDDAPTFGQ